MAIRPSSSHNKIQEPWQLTTLMREKEIVRAENASCVFRPKSYAAEHIYLRSTKSHNCQEINCTNKGLDIICLNVNMMAREVPQNESANISDAHCSNFAVCLSSFSGLSQTGRLCLKNLENEAVPRVSSLTRAVKLAWQITDAHISVYIYPTHAHTRSLMMRRRSPALYFFCQLWLLLIAMARGFLICNEREIVHAEHAEP